MEKNRPNALKKKIKDKNIRCLIQDNKDRYRRNIGICYLKKQDINSWLVKNGYAIAYRRYSKKYIMTSKSMQSIINSAFGRELL